MFNVAIIGGKDTENYEFFKSKCIFFLKNKAKSGEGITIYTIGDDFVDKFAVRYGINTRFFRTDWEKNGKNALKYRNLDILENCNGLILFDNGIKDQEIIYNMAKEKNIPSRKVKI